MVVVAVAVMSSASRKTADNGAGVGNKVIKIGIIAPLTGNEAALGEGMKNAGEMAQDMLNARTDASVTHGFTYQVVVEDDAFDPAKTVSAAQKLITVDHVSALMTLASAAGNVVAPIANQDQVVHFGIASDPNIAKGPFNFLHWTPPSEETKVFVSELEKRGYHHVAVLGANIQGIAAVADSFEKDIQGTDIQEASRQTFNFGTTDFRTMIDKAQASHPDIYLVLSFSPETEILTKQMKDAGITTPVTSIESFELSDHPEQYEGDWYVNAANRTPAFDAAYTARFGKTASLGAGNAYDIVLLVAAATEQAGAKGIPTPAEIASALHSVTVPQGALGSLSVNAANMVDTKAVVRMIKDGKPVTVGE